MFKKRNDKLFEDVFKYGYLTGKAVVEAELRFSMTEMDAFRSLQKYVIKRGEENPESGKLEYQAVINDWLEGMKKRLLFVIDGGKT